MRITWIRCDQLITTLKYLSQQIGGKGGAGEQAGEPGLRRPAKGLIFTFG